MAEPALHGCEGPGEIVTRKAGRRADQSIGTGLLCTRWDRADAPPRGWAESRRKSNVPVRDGNQRTPCIARQMSHEVGFVRRPLPTPKSRQARRLTKP